MADEPRRRRADRRQDPARAARRIALRGSAADRQARGHRSARRAKQLMRFYRDWYRPDLMAVIVVGDVDRDAVVGDDQGALLVADQSRRRSGRGRRSTCRSSPARATPSSPTRKRPRRSRRAQQPAAGAQPGDRSAAIARSCCDQLFARHARRPGSTSSASARTRRSSGPPRTAACSRCRGPRTRRSLQALVANDGVARGLDALVTELQRVARFGFTATELDAREAGEDGRLRARASRRARTASRPAAPTNTRATSSRAKRCRRSGRSSRSTGASSRRSRCAEINALTADWFPEQNRLVVVVRAGGRRRRRCRTRRSSRPSSRPPRRRSSRPTWTPAPGRRSWTRRRRAARSSRRPRVRDGITEWTLSNGATVVLKPTTLKEDQILFRAVAPGGTSLASDADFIPARVGGRRDRRRAASASSTR